MKIIDPIVPEPNEHKGVLCLLVPQDWYFLNGSYSFGQHSGIMEINTAWGDSVENCYPSQSFNNNLKWISLTSDYGYSYDEPIEITVDIELQTGGSEGCFSLGYLATKATPNLICSGNQSWAPLSFPHPMAVSTNDDCVPYSANFEEDWTGIFHRFSDWSGADGIYSIPFNGNEQNNFQNDKTLLVFSDTFIGNVDTVSGNRIPPTFLINNSYAILSGNAPNDENIEFYYSIYEDGTPKSLFIPNTENSQIGDWYWLMDGISIDEKFYLFALRMDNGDYGNLAFSIDGVALIMFDINADDQIINAEQLETPLFYEDPSGWSLVYGQAIMSMLNESMNTNNDEQIYFYGVKSYGANKEMTVGRVNVENLISFDQWEFWNGNDWTPDIVQSHSIGSNISQEFSVSQIDANSYIAIFQLNTISNYTAFSRGTSPLGPFGNFNIIWSAEETINNLDYYSYNAKAHPHLSDEGSLLVSYNVNSFNFSDHFSDPGLYRPRFISIPLDYLDTELINHNSEKTNNKSNQKPILYPNPFNSFLNISINLNYSTNIEITLHDILGRQIGDDFRVRGKPGENNMTFHLGGLNKVSNPSGIYFVKTEIDNKIYQDKVIFLK